ncbi:MAG: hypothetical protein DMF87_19180, partial [Acidobacteria bacterium]
IDPRQHTLTVHGVMDRPLTFTMEDLKRLPSVTRLHFIECAGNRSTPRAKTVQESHGMTSCAEWTGVLLSTLLKECGVKSGASWFVAEGAEEVKGASSMPLAKAMDDVLVAYGMNGEPLRPQQGFPLRLLVPGFEGIFSTKYLRRVKLVDRYYMNYNDYGHLQKDAKEAALGYQVGPKSVITRPSAGQQLSGKGFYEISGLAWSGGGAIRRVEVSTDDGKHWMDAEIKAIPQRMAHSQVFQRAPGRGSGAGQHHSAVADRQRWERAEWARIGFSRVCCSSGECSWERPCWRSRRPHMVSDARRPQRNSARWIFPSVLTERNFRRAAARPRKARSSLRARGALAAMARTGPEAARPS